MHADRTSRTFRVLASVFASALLVGCQIPGGSFGHEPLQMRLAELTRVAVEADAARAAAPEAAPERSVPERPVILAHRDAVRPVGLAR